MQNFIQTDHLFSFISELFPIIARFLSFRLLSPKYFSFVFSYYFITYGFVIPILKSIGFVTGLWVLLSVWPSNRWLAPKDEPL